MTPEPNNAGQLTPGHRFFAFTSPARSGRLQVLQDIMRAPRKLQLKLTIAVLCLLLVIWGEHSKSLGWADSTKSFGWFDSFRSLGWAVASILVLRNPGMQILMGIFMIITAVPLICGLVWLPGIRSHFLGNLSVLLAALTCIHILLVDAQVRTFRQTFGRKTDA